VAITKAVMLLRPM